MKSILLLALLLFASAAIADPAVDHKAALKEANAVFSAAFEKCEDLAVKERVKCRKEAKTQHTKAVEKADKAHSVTVTTMTKTTTTKEK